MPRKKAKAQENALPSGQRVKVARASLTPYVQPPVPKLPPLKPGDLDNPWVRKRVNRLADEMLAIADQQLVDHAIYSDAPPGNGMPRVRDFIERCRLRIETRKWLLAKLLPKTYGDATAQAGTGPVVNVQINM